MGLYDDIDFIDEKDDLPISSVVENAYVKKFLLGGNCYCKIENIKTGNTFTYKIQRNKNKSNMYFVNVESGLGYIYCGYFYANADKVDYRKGEKGNVDKTDMRIQALIYTIEHAEHLPSYVLVQHLGYCSVCGNSLLSPETMRRGICSECIIK